LTELDLSPRETPTRASGVGSLRNWIILGVLMLAAGVVLYQALTTSRVYFLNVDEAVARRAELADDTLNMQGTVITEPTRTSDGSILFTVSFGGAEADVRHIGTEPSSLFAKGERVVAKGHWEGVSFVSSQILVKHSEQYVEDNPDRVDYELPELTDER